MIKTWIMFAVWLFVYFWRSKFEVQLFLKFENYPANSRLLFATIYSSKFKIFFFVPNAHRKQNLTVLNVEKLPLCVLFRFEMRAFTALACISWMFSLFSYSRTEHTSASEDYKREFCVIIMFCLREIILHLQRCQRASIKTGIFTV